MLVTASLHDLIRFLVIRSMSTKIVAMSTPDHKIMVLKIHDLKIVRPPRTRSRPTRPYLPLQPAWRPARTSAWSPSALRLQPQMLVSPTAPANLCLRFPPRPRALRLSEWLAPFGNRLRK